MQAKSLFRALAFLALAFLTLLALPPTEARAANKTIVVYVEGADASAQRAKILELVPKTLDVVDPDKFQGALIKAGQKGPMGAVLWVPAKRDKQLVIVRKAAESVKADAVIVGRMRKGKGGVTEIYLLWVDAIPGDLPVDEAVALKGGDAAAHVAALKGVLGPALDSLAPEAAPEPKADAKPDEKKPQDTPKKDEPEDEPDKPSDRKPNQIGTAIFSLALGFEIGARGFEYTDGITQNLRPYDVFGVPMLHVEGEIYPGATSGVPVIRDIGLVAAYGHGFGLSSQTDEAQPKKFGTKWNRFLAGLRYRIRTGADGTPIIGISGKFGFQNFTFQPEGDTPADVAASKAIASEVASASYTFLRPGIDGRIPIGPFAILASFGYQIVLDAGDIDRDVYPRFTSDNKMNSANSDASVGGMDVGLGVAIRLVAGLETRLEAQYTRYFYAFTPTPGDQYVAGGALDEMLGLRLGAAYAY